MHAGIHQGDFNEVSGSRIPFHNGLNIIPHFLDDPATQVSQIREQVLLAQ
jgi:hypothetical protein